MEDYNKYEKYLKIWKKFQKKVNISYIFKNERMNCYHIIVERTKNGTGLTLNIAFIIALIM